MDSPALDIRHLDVVYQVRQGLVYAAHDISFPVPRGKVTAVVGESSSGKSTIIEAMTRTLPPNARVRSGRVMYGERDLLSLSEGELRSLKWVSLAYVPQAAQQSLNPTLTVWQHYEETARAHGARWDRDGLRREALRTLAMVKLPGERVLASYPHQLSGGMKQRVLIALALLFQPEILVLDEPTAALDVLTQAAMVELLKEIQAQRNYTVLLVTHDIAIAGELADYVAVIYGGELVEWGPAEAVFQDPQHPYTQGLLRSLMAVNADIAGIQAIPGDSPSLLAPPRFCRFSPRCPLAFDRCREERPSLHELGEARRVRCHLFEREEASHAHPV